MEPSPTYHLPQGEECETSVEHRLPLWAELAVGYCSWRQRPSPTSGSCFVGAGDVGLWVCEQKPLGNSPLGGNPSPEMTYLPTYRVPPPPPTSQASVGSIILPLWRGTPRQLVQENSFLNSWKQASSLSVHHQWLIFFIRSAGGVDQHVKFCIWRRWKLEVPIKL